MKQQKGFGVAEIIILIVLVGLIGAGVWYVWSSRVATNVPQKTVPPTPFHLIVVKELGIQFSVSDNLKDLTYTINKEKDPRGEEVEFAYFGSKTMQNLDPACDDAALGVVGKGVGTYPPSGLTKEEMATYYDGFKKQFDGFFIFFGFPQAYCSSAPLDSDSFKNTTQKQTALQGELKEAMNSLELAK